MAATSITVPTSGAYSSPSVLAAAISTALVSGQLAGGELDIQISANGTNYAPAILNRGNGLVPVVNAIGHYGLTVASGWSIKARLVNGDSSLSSARLDME